MPRAIAIETSSRTGSIAAVEDGALVAEEQFAPGLQHAALIVPIIDRLCRAQGWSPADLEELYVSAGPGSFTGLRIGVTLAKTLALATGVKLVAVPTVRVLVENAPPEARHVVIVLDAKRDQIFTARFERDHLTRGMRREDSVDDSDAVASSRRMRRANYGGADERRSSPSPGTPGEGWGEGWIEHEPAHLSSLTEMLARAPRPVHLLGEGIPYHRKFLPQDSGAAASVIVTPESTWLPRAAVVAQLGAAMAAAGRFTDPDRFTPIYIRRPEAEEKYEAARQRR